GWAALPGEAATAYPTVWAMAGSPKTAVPFLREHLKPVLPADPQKLTKLIADLDSDQFAARQKAGEELETLGELPEEAVSKRPEGKPSLEVRQRVEALLQKNPSPQLSGERLRALRAITAIEAMGSAEARQLLEQLAQGMSRARVTQEAKAAVERLRARPAASN